MRWELEDGEEEDAHLLHHQREEGCASKVKSLACIVDTREIKRMWSKNHSPTALAAASHAVICIHLDGVDFHAVPCRMGNET